MPSTVVPIAPELGNLLVTAENAGTFGILLQALEAADLLSIFADENNVNTIFAPTDAAFNKLAEEATDALMADSARLSDTLLYHAMSGSNDSAYLSELAGSTVSMRNGKEAAILLDRETLSINTSITTTLDILATNGVIHAIDTVLAPPNNQPLEASSQTVIDLIMSNSRFTTFSAALSATGLDADLSNGGPYTIFAPNESAFEALGDAHVENLFASDELLRAFVLNHVISGAMDATSVTAAIGSNLTSESGSHLWVSVDGDTLVIARAVVDRSDLEASNGIVHEIDTTIDVGISTGDCAAHASTEGYQALDSSNMSVVYETRDGRLRYYLDNYEDSYNSAIKGEATVSESIRLSSVGPAGAPAIEFEAMPCEVDGLCNGSNTQKVNFHFLAKQKHGGLTFGARDYIGFNMVVDGTDMPADEYPTLLFQLWQGTPHRPPFGAVMRGNGTSGYVDIDFQARSDSGGSNPSGQTQIIGTIENVKFGDWYQFILGTSPEHDGMEHRIGSKTIEIRYKKNSDSEYSEISSYGKWGYDPTGQSGCPYAGNCDIQTPNEKSDFKFGIYRAATDRIHSTVKYSNVKVSKTFEAANPEIHCGN